MPVASVRRRATGSPNFQAWQVKNSPPRGASGDGARAARTFRQGKLKTRPHGEHAWPVSLQIFIGPGTEEIPTFHAGGVLSHHLRSTANDPHRSVTAPAIPGMRHGRRAAVPGRKGRPLRLAFPARRRHRPDLRQGRGWLGHRDLDHNRAPQQARHYGTGQLSNQATHFSTFSGSGSSVSGSRSGRCFTAPPKKSFMLARFSRSPGAMPSQSPTTRIAIVFGSR